MPARVATNGSAAQAVLSQAHALMAPAAELAHPPFRPAAGAEHRMRAGAP
jgi:hypothetical protein